MVATKTDADVPKYLNLGCGTDTRKGYWNVDQLDLDGVDQEMDLENLPWDLPSDHFEYILLSHVLEHLQDIAGVLSEVARILAPNGRVTIHWPVGQNEIADPDHKHRWTYDTPLYYTGERPWDVDVGLKVINRDVTVHSHLSGLLEVVFEWSIQRYETRHGQGRWMFDLPFTSGEFTVELEQ